MDKCLKRIYPEAAKSVLSSNSLYGAMVVQGMAMAKLLRDNWNKIVLNETHPKVQYYAKRGIVYKDYEKKMNNWLRDEMACYDFPKISNGHEWDALFSAWVTFQAIQNGLTPDLLDITNSKSSLLFPVGTVHYYWPF